MKKRVSIILMTTIFMLSMINLSSASDYPTKPITLIVPYSPGGISDFMGRAVGSAAKKYLGQPIIVINKPGAAGMLAFSELAQASPDGYTLGVDATSVWNTIEWEIANGRKPPFTQNDLIFLGSFTLTPALVVVPSNSPWKILNDLIKACKDKPDHYAFSTGGMYGGSHLPAEVLSRAVGIKTRYVPYKSGGEALSAVVGGHVDFSCQWPATSIPLYRGNKLKILAVQSDSRLKSIPDIPTVKELGIDAEWKTWVGISAPKKTPAPVVEKLQEAMKKVAEDKSFVEIVEGQGDHVHYMNSDELTRYCKWETERLKKILKQLAEEKK